MALACGLQSYRNRHGMFPTTTDLLEAECSDIDNGHFAYAFPGHGTTVARATVRVEAVAPEQMLDRMEGTAMVFSVLGQDADGAFEWDDLTPANTWPYVTTKLNQTWDLDHRQGYEAHLDPRPVRPPQSP